MQARSQAKSIEMHKVMQ
jgi:hypothetical protein